MCDETHYVYSYENLEVHMWWKFQIISLLFCFRFLIILQNQRRNNNKNKKIKNNNKHKKEEKNIIISLIFIISCVINLFEINFYAF